MASNLPSPEQMLSDTASQPDDQALSFPKTSAAIQASSIPKPPDLSACHQTAAEIGISDRLDKTGMDARTKLSNLLKDKEQEWAAVVERKGPLRLLDLPMDVLKEIVKEVTHTNDLTALALTHSALHNLAIPHIYSRFDIVWPDAHATTDPRTGVDALTYGLATLCMGDVFTDHTQKQSVACTNCGTTNVTECLHGFQVALKSSQRRLGNQYPQFTRKFSLGNGPADWVQEYLITKESGKMLGTLVALAVARMINLETFVWDMPTGVLRDVWLALSSLQSRNRSAECRLERVWVRWHDNSDPSIMSPNQGANATASTTTSQMLAGSTMSSVGWTMPSGSITGPQAHNHLLSYAQSRVEYPTLSVLPPLKSISVLDIDELEYLDEMSILIAKSKERLRELRVGIAVKASQREFALAWDGPDLHQVDHDAKWPGASIAGERRLGGVLGILLGRVYDIRKRTKIRSMDQRVHSVQSNSVMASNIPIPPEDSPVITAVEVEHQVSANNTHNYETHVPQQIDDIIDQGQGVIDIDEKSVPISTGILSTSITIVGAEVLSAEQVSDQSLGEHSTSNSLQDVQSDADSLTTLISAHQTVSEAASAIEQHIPHSAALSNTLSRRSLSHGRKISTSNDAPSVGRERLEGKLRLQTLELERVALSVTVLQKAFDWSVLTNLTILDCPQHDRLWTMLRRHFQPTTLGMNHHSPKHGPTVQYHLNLRKIHTDAASPALITFLKETLAPNTLETLFLQDRRRSGNTTTTIDAIYRGPLKRHRSSLKKLMLDSSDKPPRGPSSSSDNTRWRAWMPNREVLNFITSGRMSSLRELSIAIDYKDWHHFLQRLPLIPHVRSLNIPFIADHVTPAFDPRELALQVVDVIVLRPEVELCYMGVSHKCFEILENRPHDESHGGEANATPPGGASGGTFTEDEDDEDEEASDDEDDDDEDDDGTAIATVDPDETESDISDHDDSDADSYDGSDEDSPSKVRLRLREILFYDDKVAVFKARHGKL